VLVQYQSARERATLSEPPDGIARQCGYFIRQLSVAEAVATAAAAVAAAAAAAAAAAVTIDAATNDDDDATTAGCCCCEFEQPNS